jgi:hypothetical protein
VEGNAPIADRFIPTKEGLAENVKRPTFRNAVTYFFLVFLLGAPPKIGIVWP